ncbi:MAG TPA: DUF1194 domain-containing protein [Acetobacteraceae bacterium]|nr:DUF1194 domain-containing protein [Acetobacteraceae bacterium]
MRAPGALLASLLLSIGVIPGAPTAAHAAPAARTVDVALVLVTDVSRSITDSEFSLEKNGYATAITSPEVLSAIHHGANGAIAITYVEFSGADQVGTVVGWEVVRDAASAKKFAADILSRPRSSYGRTAVGAGIDAAVQDIAESGFNAERRVIDVCGDGNSNDGMPLADARAEALKAGITINGLAIVHENPPPWLAPHVDPPGGIVKYYQDHVIAGPGSFVMNVRADQDFVAAMTRKFVLEIAGRRMQGAPHPL